MTQNAGKACCRLCLAPNNECVDIFKTQAADKLTIQSKISACVQIQVSVNNGKSGAAGCRRIRPSSALVIHLQSQSLKLLIVCEKNR